MAKRAGPTGKTHAWRSGARQSGTFIVKIHGEEQGPLNVVLLREMVEQGELGKDDLVRRSESQKWYPASTVKGLFPETASPSESSTEQASEHPQVDDTAVVAKSSELPDSVGDAGVDSTLMLVESDATDVSAKMFAQKSRAAAPADAAGKSAVKEYKVLTQSEISLTGTLDPEKLEELLNSHAEQGWIVKTATEVAFAGFGGTREELMIILER